MFAARDQSPVVLEESASVPSKKGVGSEMLEKEDGESPKENGGQRSNGISGVDKSDGSEDRQPDVLDDHPGKSRSTFILLILGYSLFSPILPE